MGKLLNSKIDTKSVETNKSSNSSTNTKKLYKPLSEFIWKDATLAEIQKNSIKAYEKFAF